MWRCGRGNILARQLWLAPLVGLIAACPASPPPTAVAPATSSPELPSSQPPGAAAAPTASVAEPVPRTYPPSDILVAMTGYGMCELKSTHWIPLACFDSRSDTWRPADDCRGFSPRNVAVSPLRLLAVERDMSPDSWHASFELTGWRDDVGPGRLSVAVADRHNTWKYAVLAPEPLRQLELVDRRPVTGRDTRDVRQALERHWASLARRDLTNKPVRMHGDPADVLGQMEVVKTVADIDGSGGLDVVFGAVGTIEDSLASGSKSALFVRIDGEQRLRFGGDRGGSASRIQAVVRLGEPPLLLLEDDGAFEGGPTFRWAARWDGEALRPLGRVCCRRGDDPPAGEWTDDLYVGERCLAL